MKGVLKLLSLVLGMEFYEGERVYLLKRSDLKIWFYRYLNLLNINRLVAKVSTVSSDFKGENSGQIVIDDLELQYTFYYHCKCNYAKDYWEIWEVRDYKSLQPLSANKLMRLIFKLL